MPMTKGSFEASANCFPDLCFADVVDEEEDDEMVDLC